MRDRRTLLAAAAVVTVTAAVAAAFVVVSRSGAIAQADSSAAITVTRTMHTTVTAASTPAVTVPLRTDAPAAATSTPSGSPTGSVTSTGSVTPTSSAAHPTTAAAAAHASATSSSAASSDAGASATTSSSAATGAASSTALPIKPKAINPEHSPSAAHIARAVSRAVAAAAHRGITEGVVVLDRRTGAVIYRHDSEVEMPSVSIAKLLFAVDELHRAGGGSALDAATLGRLDRMISTSDDDVASDYYGEHGESAIVDRVAAAYHLTETHASPNPRYWGDISITARDIAALLQQALADPQVGPFLAPAMRAATATAADGYDQEFGMNAVTGAGSKQGWGCCLGGVVAIHSAGFTSRDIVVVLSKAAPDATGINVPDVAAFQDDPGFVASVAAVTATVQAAVDPDG